MKLFLLLFLFSPLAFSQVTGSFPSEQSEAVPSLEKPAESPIQKTIEESKPVEDRPEGKIQEVREGSANTKERRGDSLGTVMVGYQLFTTWLPGKKTVSYTHIFNRDWSLEGEYAWSSIEDPVVGIDLASVKEKRFTLQARRYAGNSFNVSFGPEYSTFSAKAGTDIVGQGVNSSFSAENLGFSAGFGNRWQWGNGITFGIDWMRMNIPIFETKVEDDVLDDITNTSGQEDIKKVIRAFNRIPTFVLFGVNIGYTF